MGFFFICFWVVHSGGGRGCDVAQCGGGFYGFCSQLVVEFDLVVVVVGFLGFVGGGGGVFFSQWW